MREVLSKKAVVEKLMELKDSIKDKKLKDMVIFNLKKVKENHKEVPKEELMELLEDVFESMKPKEEKKKKLVSGKKKVTASDEEVNSILNILDSGTSKSTSKKSKIENPVKRYEEPTKEKEKEKSVEKKSLKVKTTTPKVEKEFIFPDTLTVGGNTLEKLSLETPTMDILSKLIDDGKEIIFACHWSKKHLKNFTYDVSNVYEKKVASFDNDLDLLQPIHISEVGRIMYTVSLYTEVNYHFRNDDLKRVEDSTSSWRECNGLDFEIYITPPEKKKEEKKKLVGKKK